MRRDGVVRPGKLDRQVIMTDDDLGASGECSSPFPGPHGWGGTQGQRGSRPRGCNACRSVTWWRRSLHVAPTRRESNISIGSQRKLLELQNPTQPPLLPAAATAPLHARPHRTTAESLPGILHTSWLHAPVAEPSRSCCHVCRIHLTGGGAECPCLPETRCVGSCHLLCGVLSLRVFSPFISLLDSHLLR